MSFFTWFDSADVLKFKTLYFVIFIKLSIFQMTSLYMKYKRPVCKFLKP